MEHSEIIAWAIEEGDNQPNGSDRIAAIGELAG
jgi:hypothetical protein